jgi:hypothetical protein
MYKITVVETSPTKTTVTVESTTLKEQDLLRLGRVQDALNFLDGFERKANSNYGEVYLGLDVHQGVRMLKSYDPTNTMWSLNGKKR